MAGAGAIAAGIACILRSVAVRLVPGVLGGLGGLGGLVGLGLGLAVASGICGVARAALPDEIQVYTDDINAPGERGLELHINTTPRGNLTPGYAGERLTHHGTRITPEFSYGLTPSLEVGLYLPLVLDGHGRAELAGIKPRLKWLPIRPADGESGWFAGTNAELARVGFQFEEARTVLELRNIVGWTGRQWSFAVNPILRWGVSPGYRGAPEFELDLRAIRRFSDSFSAGLETYWEFGPLNRFAPGAEQAKLLFAVLEYQPDKSWAIHLGVGHGWGAGDPWTVKSIISFPF